MTSLKALLLALALPAAIVAAQWVEDPPLRDPDLSKFEPAIQEQLREAAALVAEMRSAPDPDRESLAAAYGRLGQLYYVYDLNASAAAALRNAARLAEGSFDWVYLIAVLEHARGDLVGAATSFERALGLRPHVPALVRLGDTLRELGRPEEAAARYREALERDPGLAAALEGLGRLALQGGRHQEAATHFQRALELQPEATALHHQLGLAYRALGDVEAARRHLAANTGGRVRLPDPALDGLGAMLKSTMVHFAAGVRAMRAGNAKEAIRGFEAALAAHPKDALAAYNLALAHLELGRREEATRWLGHALEIDPDFRNAHYNLASLLAEEGRVAEAERHFRRAHEIDPNDAASHAAWAKALAALGERKRSLAELDLLLQHEPGNAEALVVRGIVEAQLGREMAAEASFRAAAASGSAEADAELGRLFERQGRWREAEQSYRAAVAREPQRLEAWERLGNLLARDGRFPEAAAAFERVVAGAPERAEARLGWTMALLLAGEDAAALAALEEGVAQSPESLLLAHLLARLLAASAVAEVRDGERALALSQRVLARASTVEHAQTVAMALAELGRFVEAIALQAQVVGQLEAAGEAQEAALAGQRLEAYRRGAPVRAPWRAGP